VFGDTVSFGIAIKSGELLDGAFEMSLNRGMAVAVIAAMLVCDGCRSGGLAAHRYGIKSIAAVDSRTLYLKREVGSFFDRTALSLNGDRCVGPNDDADYLFVERGAGESPLYYAVRPDGLVVYDSTLRPPARSAWTLAIQQQELRGEPHFGGRDEDYVAKGASKAQLLLADLQTCK
jgi:hypothetical protein